MNEIVSVRVRRAGKAGQGVIPVLWDLGQDQFFLSTIFAVQQNRSFGLPILAFWRVAGSGRIRHSVGIQWPQRPRKRDSGGPHLQVRLPGAALFQFSLFAGVFLWCFAETFSDML